MKRLLVLLLILFASSPAAQELIMFEERGCHWCGRWNAEIAPIYPQTEEGRAAPLHRVDIAGPRPEALQDIRPVIYTPTFVLMKDGREYGRIEGYPGEDFFWGLLGRMIKEMEDGTQ